jgi:protocatechuate 3,4-dioxygenase beta subunit
MKRDLADLTLYESISHDVTAEGYTLDTPEDVLFDSNSTTALVPEVTIGPYFVSGEFIRTDVTEGTQGVPIHLEMQYVDINTFEPVPDLLVDIWHTNATGVYSGVSAAGQGGLNSTFLRGVGATDSDGVVEFDTIFPGHYNGRAHHIHLLVTQNSTLLPNNTYVAGKTDHIGQLFFNQDLISEVELLDPYNTNTQGLVPTLSDGIAAQQATSEYDPLVDYVLLGDSLQDGLLAFIIVGIDTTANYTSSYTPAAHYQEGGGVVSNSRS